MKGLSSVKMENDPKFLDSLEKKWNKLTASIPKFLDSLEIKDKKFSREKGEKRKSDLLNNQEPKGGPFGPTTQGEKQV